MTDPVHSFCAILCEINVERVEHDVWFRAEVVFAFAVISLT
jgi:hypothetical protein